jgi:hypothetical protein
MEFSTFILAFLFMMVFALFAYCLTEPRGKNTIHARKRSNTHAVNIDKNVGLKQDPISQSKDVAYNIQKNQTEAA